MPVLWTIHPIYYISLDPYCHEFITYYSCHHGLRPESVVLNLLSISTSKPDSYNIMGFFQLNSTMLVASMAAHNCHVSHITNTYPTSVIEQTAWLGSVIKISSAYLSTSLRIQFNPFLPILNQGQGQPICQICSQLSSAGRPGSNEYQQPQSEVSGS